MSLQSLLDNLLIDPALSVDTNSIRIEFSGDNYSCGIPVNRLKFPPNRRVHPSIMVDTTVRCWELKYVEFQIYNCIHAHLHSLPSHSLSSVHTLRPLNLDSTRYFIEDSVVVRCQNGSQRVVANCNERYLNSWSYFAFVTCFLLRAFTIIFLSKK